MATFTRTLWETGDTITADGLNGGKGGKWFLTMTDADLNEDDQYEFEVSADLEYSDLFDGVFVSEEGEANVVTGVTDHTNFYSMEFTDNYGAYYDPIAKKLQSSIPQDNGGGSDIG